MQLPEDIKITNLSSREDGVASYFVEAKLVFEGVEKSQIQDLREVAKHEDLSIEENEGYEYDGSKKILVQRIVFDRSFKTDTVSTLIYELQ